jgi:hypothetical protein
MYLTSFQLTSHFTPENIYTLLVAATYFVMRVYTYFIHCFDFQFGSTLPIKHYMQYNLCMDWMDSLLSSNMVELEY